MRAAFRNVAPAVCDSCHFAGAPESLLSFLVPTITGTAANVGGGLPFVENDGLFFNHAMGGFGGNEQVDPNFIDLTLLFGRCRKSDPRCRSQNF